MYHVSNGTISDAMTFYVVGICCNILMYCRLLSLLRSKILHRQQIRTFGPSFYTRISLRFIIYIFNLLGGSQLLATEKDTLAEFRDKISDADYSAAYQILKRNPLTQLGNELSSSDLMFLMIWYRIFENRRKPAFSFLFRAIWVDIIYI